MTSDGTRLSEFDVFEVVLLNNHFHVKHASSYCILYDQLRQSNEGFMSDPRLQYVNMCIVAIVSFSSKFTRNYVV